ncbi:MAG: hypothetical protein AAF385_05940 [Pseudomonadota bacterium]
MVRANLVLMLLTTLTISACQETEDTAEQTATAAELECQGSDGFDAMLCSDPELKSMQADLDKMVSRVVSRSDHNGQADVRAAQKRWQAERDACLGLSVAKQRQCLDASYLGRMNDLQDTLDDLN